MNEVKNKKPGYRTKYEWISRYTPEGQLEPDQFGRWAIDLYMFVNISKALPEYEFVKEMTEKAYLPVRVATICQKGCTPDNVPSLSDRFCVNCPTFEDAGNSGFSPKSNFFSNDIEELKKIAEKQFDHLRTVFKYCR